MCIRDSNNSTDENEALLQQIPANFQNDETIVRIKEMTDKQKKTKLKTRYTFTAENAEEILRREVGAVFATVLEHAGVYKCTPEGREAFLSAVADGREQFCPLFFFCPGHVFAHVFVFLDGIRFRKGQFLHRK